MRSVVDGKLEFRPIRSWTYECDAGFMETYIVLVFFRHVIYVLHVKNFLSVELETRRLSIGVALASFFTEGLAGSTQSKIHTV